jgi:hemoglobin
MEVNDKPDIRTLDDVKLMVNRFYEQVFLDDLLGPIFNERIGQRRQEHLDKMYTFWQTLLLGERSYFGAPFAPHARMPVFHEHFERWVKLFEQTVRMHFAGETADEAVNRAKNIARIFESKREIIRKLENSEG